MKKLPKYSPEARERAIRMVFEHLPEYESQWATNACYWSPSRCTRSNRCGRWKRKGCTNVK
ncbi:hypothetical protein ALP80_200135 [Pseudomonas savastanoi pv. fraxini]|nr:hypothetical protein ALP80_200135 [Pseudomonas savastanoi pv. fraxini]